MYKNPWRQHHILVSQTQQFSVICKFVNYWVWWFAPRKGAVGWDYSLVIDATMSESRADVKLPL